MRAGLTVSALGHAGLIALAIVGIGMGRPLEPTVVESIAVDLVPVSEFSNIRMGSLDSTVVETEAPSAVDTETPAEIAQPTGNTQEDQARPADNEQVTPAPTEQVAPAPQPTEPEPAPEPVAEPEAAPPEPVVPVSAPEPEPAPAPEPEPAPAEDTPLAIPEAPAEPTEVAPQPRARTASLDQKRAEYQKQLQQQKEKAEADKKAAEEKKAEDAKKAAEQKKADDAKKAAEQKKAEEQRRTEQARADEDKLLDEIGNIVNQEESRGATTGQGGQATLGREDGRSATLSKSEIDGLVAQIKQCMNIPAGAAEAGVTAQLEFSLDASGMVTQLPRLVSAPTDGLSQAYASAAQRAVMRCGPYAIANEQIRATFDPRDF